MSQKMSIYLDFLRTLLSMFVLLGHARGYVLPSLPKILASHAEEAVIAFFVMSGFMMSFVIEHKEKTCADYVKARIFRLYSVVPLALATTYFADMLGRAIYEPSYRQIPFFDSNYNSGIWYAISFTNEIWFSHHVFGTNEAYWSLGFEVPFYIIFGTFKFTSGFARFAVVALMIMCGPKILIFLPHWALGVLVFRLLHSRRFKLGHYLACIIFFISIVFYILNKISFGSGIKTPIFDFGDVANSEYITSYIYYSIVAILCASNLLVFNFIQLNDNLLNSRITKFVRWVAGGSFTLYLTHQPILTLFRAVMQRFELSSILGLLFLILTIAVAYGLSEIGERRKELIRTIFAQNI